jgi:uncharacterized protein (DUF1697 family)
VKHVALLRGINVGTAKPVLMAKLAHCFEELGYCNVKTVLRSGNVVFEADVVELEAGAAVEAAVLKATGVQASVVLMSGSKFTAIAEANPLVKVATDGSKSFVSFVASGVALAGLLRPEASELAPEVLEVGSDAIYQWMPAGWLRTAVPKSFWKQLDCPVTTRNWNTVRKILALLR